MNLMHAYLRPGKVREVLDNYGNIKCSAVGIFKEDEVLEKLPPVSPSPFMRTSATGFSKPQVGDDIWVMFFKDNPRLIFYSFQGDAKTMNSGDLDVGYDDVEIMSKRGDSLLMCDSEDGWTMKNGDGFMNVSKDNINIANSKRGITMTENGIRLTSDKEDQPMVLGNELKVLLQDLCSMMNNLGQTAMSNPHTAPLGAIIKSNMLKVESRLKKILSENNYVS